MALPCSDTDREYNNFVEDKDGNVARRVVDALSHDKLDAIIAALGGSSGTAFFAETQTVTTPGSTQTLITEVVPVGTTRSLNKVVVVCRRSAKFEIKINSTVVGSGRTGSASMNASFVFLPVRYAASGDTITIDFEQTSSGPSVDVEVYLMATDVT
jgi:hypothetical protein